MTAELAGFGKVQKQATVTLDSTAPVNLSLQLSTTAEITVTGEAPMVDLASTTQGSNYSAKVIEKLPLGRNYADVVFTQPGVQADFGETQGRSLAISIYGSTSSENLFLIDGVNTTNVIKGFQGKDINSEFIQEVEVKTGGYQAEYGRNTGGVVNVITKSGGNEFHGGVFGYYNDTGMRADVDIEQTPGFSEQGTADQVAGLGPNYFLEKEVRQEWGADLGGFVIKDKIWFFGAYDRVQVNQNVEPIDGPRAYEHFPHGVRPEQVLGQADPQPAPGHLDRRQRLLRRAARRTARSRVADRASHGRTSYNGRQDTGGPDYGARLNQLFGSFGIFTFQYSQHRDRYTTKPFGLDVPQFRDYTTDPTGTNFTVLGGFGNVFGPTVNNKPRTREPTPDRSRRTSATTRSRSAATTRTTPPRLRPSSRAAQRVRDPSLPADRREHLRSRARSVLHERQRTTVPGLLPARPAGRRHDRQLRDHRRFAVQHADQTLQRLHPGPVADHPDADHEPRRPLRRRELLRFSRIRPPAPSRRST